MLSVEVECRGSAAVAPVFLMKVDCEFADSLLCSAGIRAFQDVYPMPDSLINQLFI